MTRRLVKLTGHTQIECREWADIKTYREVEKRGFRVDVRGGEKDWQKVEYVGNLENRIC